MLSWCSCLNLKVLALYGDLLLSPCAASLRSVATYVRYLLRVSVLSDTLVVDLLHELKQ